MQGSADLGRRLSGATSRFHSPLEKVPAAATSAGSPWLALDNMSVQEEEEETVVTSKMQEQSGNVYENKGSDFHDPEQSGDVIDYKGDSH